jgi:hypothetical protein
LAPTDLIADQAADKLHLNKAIQAFLMGAQPGGGGGDEA